MVTYIVDTDAGPDDVMALAYLLSRDDVEVEAISIAYGLAHTQEGAVNVAKVVALASGKPNIPIFLGHQEPLQGNASFPEFWRNHADELPGVDLPTQFKKPETKPAIDFLRERLEDASRPVCILALGALTNLGYLANDSIPALREIVIMGGAFEVPGNIHVSPPISRTAEWNIFVDPAAAQRVFQLGVPMLIIPLDATNKVPIGFDFIDMFRTALSRNKTITPLGRMVEQLFESVRDFVKEGSYYAWDLLAAVAMLERHVVQTSDFAISVGQIGSPDVGTTRCAATGPLVSVAQDASREEFERLFINAFETE